MKFRLPSRRASAPGTRRPLDRSRLLFYLLGLAIFLLTFAVSLYLFLPISPLRERIEREISRSTGGEASIGRLALRFPPGLRAESVLLRGTGIPGRDTVEIPAVLVDPLWSSLLAGNPGVNFQASLPQGDLKGGVRKDGRLNLRVVQVPFAETVMAGSAIKINGLLRDGTFAGAFPIKPETDTRLDLALDQLRITGLEALGVTGGAVALGNLQLQGGGKGNALKIDRLETTGGDLQITGSGTILLSQPVNRSRLNLQLSLRPGPNFDPNLRGLLDLFAAAEPNGTYRLRLNGTPASPILAK